jgi:HD-GYP domain-containing protein (c-di-GMP phosphodiesterase class II)
MHRLDRNWLSAWSVLLDVNQGVAGYSSVAALLRAAPVKDPPKTSRFLPAAVKFVGIEKPKSPVKSVAAGESAAAGTLAASGTASTDKPAGFFAAAFPVARSIGGQLGDAGAPRRRTAELLAALSAGLDAAENRAHGHAVRTAIIAAQLGHLLDRSEDMRSALLYAGLLNDAGTTGRAQEPSKKLLPSLTRRTGPRSARTPVHLSRPDRAAAVIRALGLSIQVAEAVCSADERWDGKGPMKLREHSIPLGGRILAVAFATSEAAGRAMLQAARKEANGQRAVDMVRREVGGQLRSERLRQLDPEVVAVLLRQPDAFWTRLVAEDPIKQLLDAEPAGDIRRSSAAHIDTVCATFADLVDTRTPLMGRHGVRMARLAERVAARLGFDDAECRELRRAGLLHHIGKLLVPIEILEKPAALTDEERAVVQHHPQIGADILRRSRILAGLAPLIEAQAEKLDGTGAFPAFSDERTALAARILAVCDRYEAMTSRRPYRAPLARAEVWKLLEESATEPLAKKALSALRMVVEPN